MQPYGWMTPIPAEKTEYANAIKDDVRWLGFDWEERTYHASDYFDQFYEWAIQLMTTAKLCL